MKNLNFFILMSILAMNLSGQQAMMFEESTIGDTYYDLQTWRTMQNRVYNFDDGTVGAVWNRGMNFPNFNDLGICYNYFDGNQWDPYPFESITSGWSVFPSYTDYGDNGEICVSQGISKLYINWRLNKGNGPWQENVLNGNMRHPVVVTTGPENEIVHLLYLKADENFVPTEPQPDRGFIWYARSTDGMQTWDINEQFDEIGPDHYLAFTIGAYTWAEPKGDVIAFVAGDYLTDLVLMKSMDGGDTWQKTIIWQHPYPNLEIFSVNTDTFYCNGGSMSVALDNFDVAHVAFGLSQVYSSTIQDTIWYNPYADGIAYWREDMPPFKNTMNSLNPDSLSTCDNLIGWWVDINNNGTMDVVSPTSYPALGMSIHPVLTITEDAEFYLVFSSISEIYNNGIEDYRHLWLRYSPDFGCLWGNFVHLTSDIIHIFDECVYPSVAPNVSDYLQLVYQHDIEPGLAIGGDDPFTENNISFMNVGFWEKGFNDQKGIFVDFRINQDSIFEGDTVQFQNLSCGCPFPILFTWEFEGGIPLSSLEQHPSVVYNVAGIYDVQLQVSNGINNSVELKQDYIKVYPYTSIKKNQTVTQISITPNPTTGKLTIQNIGEEHVEVTVINLLGKVVMDMVYQSGQNGIVVDLAGNNEGIYFVEIKSGSEKTIQKVILRK